MLKRMKIGSRLVTLITVQAVVLLIIGLTTIAGLNYATNTTARLNQNVIEQVKLNLLQQSISGDLMGVVNRVSRGSQGWAEAGIDLMAARAVFENNWREYLADRTTEEKAEIKSSMGGYITDIREAFDQLETLFALQDRQLLHEFMRNNLDPLVNPMLSDLRGRIGEQQIASEKSFSESAEANKEFFNQSVIVMIAGLSVAILLGFFIFRSIKKPVNVISKTVAKVSDGDFYARTNLAGNDELGELGKAFDNLLEDKVATLVKTEQENTMLNESVIALLQAVSKLSKRDLTVRVPVTEDVTGPVADALNVLTSETSKVLQGVRSISEEVARASAKVKAQSDQVILVASQEREEVIETAERLAEAARTMNDIAELADSSNKAAEEAIEATRIARETVTSTVGGINNIREIIHETEKRIKRLGERSQEISRAVNLINSISERTHILALNASMHAASAGEAGKGFAVVADEVQRLAENARDATAQISTLVNNIQVETSDTVATMNNVITQVVEGSELAEKAGQQMQKTQESTSHLVASVKQIASSSVEQARVANQLQLRADQIKQSTIQTSEQLQQQTLQTNRLVQYAKSLLNAVQVFKLPGTTRQKQAEVVDGPTATDTEVAHKKAS